MHFFNTDTYVNVYLLKFFWFIKIRRNGTTNKIIQHEGVMCLAEKPATSALFCYHCFDYLRVVTCDAIRTFSYRVDGALELATACCELYCKSSAWKTVVCFFGEVCQSVSASCSYCSIGIISEDFNRH